MRLTQIERRAIREAVAEVFGSSAVVRLFGSRTRDNIVGGDVDSHIETDPLPERDRCEMGQRENGVRLPIPKQSFADSVSFPFVPNIATVPERETFARERRLWSMLGEALDEAKVDILVTSRGRDLRPIEKVAYRDGLLV